MLTYPNINPIALHVGPLSVHWYGLMYLVGLVGAWGLLNWRVQNASYGFTREQVSDIVFYAALGIIIGGRVGYMVFYGNAELHTNLWSLLQIWNGGMSFHGGMLGVIIAMCFYARKIKKSVVDITDFIAPVVPIGLGAGRIGNFINSELWGKVTNVPWGMVFPNGGSLPRHPSQLYEFLLEGVVLFIILWLFSRKPRPCWSVSGMFLCMYGLFRFGVEFFRVPDLQVGYLAYGWVTEGQLLSAPMIVSGAIMLVWAYRRKISCSNT